MSKTFQDWIEFAKQHKSCAVEETERGDITPTVIVERDGETCAVVIAPQVDKELGFQAAAMAQAGFDPDALIVLLDAHVNQMSLKEGQTAEQAEQEYRKRFPKGMQHACDTEGACATGEITDCLVCHRIDREGTITMVSLPYSYHGKDGPPFQWLDQDERYKGITTPQISKVNGEGYQLQGKIPEVLREIMATPSLFEKVPELKQAVELMEEDGFSVERARFHTARAMISLMKSHKFVVLDFISGRHPDWTDAIPKANQILDKMIEEGFFPKESHDPMKEIIDAHMGKPEFKSVMSKLLSDNPYWLPSKIRDDVERFVSELEAFCMSPNVPKEDSEENSGSFQTKSDFKPKRVRVWNGDRSEFLGEGNYVSDVTVYFIQMPDGSLQSGTNAELEPEDEDVPEGGVVRKVGNNPKIIMDSGEVVYGCQVWWEPAVGWASESSMLDGM